MSHDDPRLVGKRVLVTGCGGPAGVAVIEALDTLGCIPIPADCDPLAAGLHFGFPGTVLSRADEPEFKDALLRAATEMHADAVIVTVGEELDKVAGTEDQFAANHIAAWFPRADTVTACLDKKIFADRIHQAGIPAPRTSVGTPGALPGPWVIKPRRGRGSRDVYFVEDPEDFPALLHRVPDPIVQTQLSGREFTVDCLIDRDGSVLGAVPRWREQTRGGISTRGTTFQDDRVDMLVRDLVVALEFTGVCNVQGFLDSGGPARVIEMNPRFSGGLPISLAAGADFVGQYLLSTLGYSPTSLRYATGVTSVRWLVGVVADVAAMSSASQSLVARSRSPRDERSLSSLYGGSGTGSLVVDSPTQLSLEATFTVGDQ